MEQPTTKPFRVLIVDRHEVARHALRSQLDSDNGFEPVGEANTPDTAAAAVAELHPDLILFDDSKPAAIHSLHAAAPNAKILVLGLENDAIYANRALDAGAEGYIARETINGTLLGLLHRIADGEHRLVCLP